MQDHEIAAAAGACCRKIAIGERKLFHRVRPLSALHAPQKQATQEQPGDRNRVPRLIDLLTERMMAPIALTFVQWWITPVPDAARFRWALRCSPPSPRADAGWAR